MAVTYEPIATTTLSSAGSNTTFSSISGSYTDLVLVIAGSANPGQNIAIQVGNGSADTGANYSAEYLAGDGTNAVTGRFSNQTSALVGAIYSGQSTQIINIMNYSNTTTYKMFISKSGGAVGIYNALWRSTAAINIIKITNSLDAGTVLTLYGIKAA
jgi:hypothetical protein